MRDEWTDRRTDGVKPIYPPNNFVVYDKCKRSIDEAGCIWEVAKYIIFLQETHSTVETETLWKTHWSELVFMSHATSTSNSRGTCFLIHKWVSFELHKCIRDPYRRFVIIGIFCGYAIQSGRHPELSQRPLGRLQVDPPAADFPRDVCLTVLRNHKVIL